VRRISTPLEIPEERTFRVVQQGDLLFKFYLTCFLDISQDAIRDKMLCFHSFFPLEIHFAGNSLFSIFNYLKIASISISFEREIDSVQKELMRFRNILYI